MSHLSMPAPGQTMEGVCPLPNEDCMHTGAADNAAGGLAPPQKQMALLVYQAQASGDILK
jgi:hypothetical protein